MTAAEAGPWRVHLLTVDTTRLRLRAMDPGPGAPWVASRALRGLARCEARPAERPDVLGAGHGAPLLSRHRLGWRGRELHLECLRDRTGEEEVRLELPPWDELAADPAIDEDALWELVDELAVAVGATGGDLGDGDADCTRAALLRRAPVPDAYRLLEASGLAVLLH